MKKEILISGRGVAKEHQSGSFSADRRHFFKSLVVDIKKNATKSYREASVEGNASIVFDQVIEKERFFCFFGGSVGADLLNKFGPVLVFKGEFLPPLSAIQEVCSLSDELPVVMIANYSSDIEKSDKNFLKNLSGFSCLVLLTPVLPVESFLKKLPLSALLVVENVVGNLTEALSVMPKGSDVFAVPEGSLSEEFPQPLVQRIRQFYLEAEATQT